MLSSSNYEQGPVLHSRDRREGSRFDANMKIIFSPFNSRRSVVEFHTRTCNHSHQGACFEFSQPLHPGTVLFIRAEQITGMDAEKAGLFRTTTLAEVKWCEKSANERSGAFRVGVSYY